VEGGQFSAVVDILLLPWLQLVGSLIYLVCGAIVVGYAVTFQGGLLAWFSSGAWALAPLFLCFGLGPFAIWGPVYRATARRETSVRVALGLGLANWCYLSVHYVAIWWAFGRMVRTRHDWKKTARLSAGLDPGLRADGLPLATLPCVLRVGSAASGPGPGVVQGRLRFPTSSTEGVLTEVS